MLGLPPLLAPLGLIRLGLRELLLGALPDRIRLGHGVLATGLGATRGN